MPFCVKCINPDTPIRLYILTDGEVQYE